ncbi:lipopolysaccharide biosynthesis protein [Sodalis ligni]|uniref:O-antigen/teichoic acid export membrane protein n=1 Tax=Sodalis ligni TaxID=2697027 RepID=A0A4V2Q3N0_9GAMM|nr:lipopolysaccharide biosynthesis protein [Sodalis ligni]TCL07348.1 O-antigen/teichoic acid export membrane protein [Sodalis ligni]
MANNTQGNNHGKVLLRSTAWALFDNMSSQILNFVIFAALARFVSPADIGLLTLSLLFVQLFRLTVYSSIATAIVRKAHPTEEDYNTAFIMCLILAAPAVIVLYLLAPFIEHYTRVVGVEKIVRYTALMLITNGLSCTHEAWLRHNLQFRSLAARSFISLVAGGVVGVGLAYNKFGVMSLVAQQLVTSVSALALLWRLTPWRPRLQFSRKSFLEIINYSKHVAATTITNFANQNSDSFFITYFLGASATGLYAAGKRICNTITMALTAAFSRAALPGFARASDELPQLRKLYVDSTALTILVLSPLFVGLAIYAQDTIALLLGKKWLEAAPVLACLALSGAITSLNSYNQSILLVKNRPHWQTRLAIISGITNLITFALFTRYGIFWTAVAFSVRAVLYAPLSTWCALTTLGLNWKVYLKACLPTIISSIIMAMVLLFIKTVYRSPIPLVNILIGVIIGAPIYIIIAWVTIPSSYRYVIKQNWKFWKAKRQIAKIDGKS